MSEELYERAMAMAIRNLLLALWREHRPIMAKLAAKNKGVVKP